jgi:rare lipoprotein A
MKLILFVLSFICLSNISWAQSKDSTMVLKTIKASYYANKFEGRKTTSGARYREALFTAAHKTLPFGTLVMVTNPLNGKFIRVLINDRGPFGKGLSLDLSKAAAKAIGLFGRGVGMVDISYFLPAKKTNKDNIN